jgi:mannose-1-phosphate guanylyltransferase
VRQPTTSGSCGSEVRCGIVLAAGDGTRMREYVQRLRGDDLPKQYVNFIGERSMLEHTFQRAEKLIPAQRLFTVVARDHCNFAEARSQLAWRPRQTVLIQPYNRDTAAGILLPLMHLYKQYPDAVTAIFPSDHFILEEDRFMRYVELGFELVAKDNSKIALLGIEPEFPDTELGYIVPGEETHGGGYDRARRVELFVEKPSSQTVAEKIIKTGALWNTFVSVAKVTTLLDMFQCTTHRLFRAFQPILQAIGSPAETQVTERVYQGLANVNFSKDVIEPLPFELRRSLSVLRVRGVMWNDWGTSERLLRTLEQLGIATPRQRRPVAVRTSISPTRFVAQIPRLAKRVP